MARNYVAMPYEYLEEMSDLTDEEFGQLMRALISYSRDDKPIELTNNARFFAKRAMAQEDRHKKHYDKVSAQRREAGREGANARWGNDSNEWQPVANDDSGMANDSKPSQEIATDSKAWQPIANDSTEWQSIANDSKPKQTIANDSKNGYTKTKTKYEYKNNTPIGVLYPPLSPLNEKSPELQKAVVDWLNYKAEIKKTYTETGLKSLISTVVKKSDEYGEAAVIEAITTSMASRYQGFTWWFKEHQPPQPNTQSTEARKRDDSSFDLEEFDSFTLRQEHKRDEDSS